MQALKEERERKEAATNSQLAEPSPSMVSQYVVYYFMGKLLSFRNINICDWGTAFVICHYEDYHFKLLRHFLCNPLH